jgi:hypothetical protein
MKVLSREFRTPEAGHRALMNGGEFIQPAASMPGLLLEVSPGFFRWLPRLFAREQLPITIANSPAIVLFWAPSAENGERLFSKQSLMRCGAPCDI